MDPNEVLRRIRELAWEVESRAPGPDVIMTTPFEDDAVALAEAVKDLDDWLSKGGSVPAAWTP